MTIGYLYDLTVSIYAACVCCYFIDFLQTNRKAHRFAFWLLSIVWLFQGLIFYFKFRMTGEFPILTPLDGLFFVSWILVTVSIVLNRFFRGDFFVFFANIVGFIIMAFTLFGPAENTPAILSSKLLSDLLIIHITIAFIAYGAFTISFILSMMYLIEYALLKRKKWVRRLFRFGSLSRLEQASFLCNLIGVPLLFISLILGIVRAYTSPVPFSFFDPKVLTSFIILVVYGFYFYIKIGKNVYGKTLVFWNTVAFLLVMINVFLSGSLTGFHLW
ncbi:inner membrane protein YpjD [Camelliibacillus cellulosilyticus]|uniref:Inner membrane protein YpjD n=1 Tax=Camelliibacillus cellulosilyticus TaxID=2174486 RepID=A0ABV9GMP3_9BACL